MKKKSQFSNLLKMDLCRCIGAKRFTVIIAFIVVLLIANVWESVVMELQYKLRMMGSLEKLMELLIFDRFKAAVVVLLSAVYTFELCDDRNSSYDKLILFRCKSEEYLLSKLVSNAIGVVFAVCISFVLFSIVLLPIMPLVGEGRMTQDFGYFTVAMDCAGPFAYNILVGLLFGLFAVSVTSFGILAVSIFPNRYVGIAASFVAFYVIYALTGSFPFSVNVWYLSAGVQVLNTNGFTVNYFYAIGIMILFCVVPWCLCFWAMKRRKHEGWI